MINEREKEGGGTLPDRRQLSFRDLSTLFVFLLQFGGIVWAVSAFKNSVDNLQSSFDDLRLTVKQSNVELTNIRLDYNTRVTVLESRVTKLERDVEILKGR